MKKLINRLIDSLTAIPSDKWTHLVFSLLIGYFTAEVFRLTGLEMTECIIRALFLTMGAGIAKELWDELCRKGADIRELAWDAGGCAIGLLMFIV